MKIEAYRIKTNIKLGREIFENIPHRWQPIWAKYILSHFDRYAQHTPDAVYELYRIIDDENHWSEAYKRFCEIREYSLWNLFDQPEEYFQLAENVARVTYNASGNISLFDKSSGWYIPSLAMKAADYYKSDKLKEELLSAILVFHQNGELANQEMDVQDVVSYLEDLRLAL